MKRYEVTALRFLTREKPAEAIYEVDAANTFDAKRKIREAYPEVHTFLHVIELPSGGTTTGSAS